VACPLNESQLSSLDFAMNRFLMKLFSTSNMEIITYCREQFNFDLSSVILARHTSLFLDKLRHCDNCLIKMLCELSCSCYSNGRTMQRIVKWMKMKVYRILVSVAARVSSYTAPAMHPSHGRRLYNVRR